MGEVIDILSRASVTKKAPVVNTDYKLLFETASPIDPGTYVQIEGAACVVIWTCGPKLCVLDLDYRGKREVYWSHGVKVLAASDVRENVRGLRAMTRDRDTYSGVIQAEQRRADGSIALVLLDHGEDVREWYPFSSVMITGRDERPSLWPHP